MILIVKIQIKHSPKHQTASGFLILFGRDNFNRTVVIAMVAVLMVQASVYDVIDVVAVRYGFVSAAFAVYVSRAIVYGTAAVRIGIVHVQTVFIVMPCVRVVQMSVVQVIDVAVVADGGVSAAFAVSVLVVDMGLTLAHDALRIKCV